MSAISNKDTRNNSSTSIGWRKGKWSLEEEKYVELLIEEFKLGALPLAPGTTLRYFVSKMINCNPKRVSKKFENSKYNGKRRYKPSSVARSTEETKMRRERLQQMERKFLVASKRMEEDSNLNESQLEQRIQEIRVRALQSTIPATRSPWLTSAAVGVEPNMIPRDTLQDCMIAQRIDSKTGTMSQDASVSRLRNMSLSSTSNTSLGLPDGFPPPGSTDKRQFDRAHKTSNSTSLDLPRGLSFPGITATAQFSGPNCSQKTSSLDCNTSLTLLPGQQLHSSYHEEGTFAWKIRRQRFLEAGNCNLSFSKLPGDRGSHHSNQFCLSLPYSDNKCSQLDQYVVEEQLRHRTPLDLRGASARDLTAQHCAQLQWPSLIDPMSPAANLRFTGSLKRGAGNDDILESLRPNKRF